MLAEGMVAGLMRGNMPQQTTRRLFRSAQIDAIADAVASSQPGDRIIVHDVECSASDDVDCTCEPIVLEVRGGR